MHYEQKKKEGIKSSQQVDSPRMLSLSIRAQELNN